MIMKRISILALLVCALSLNACAQWYLFPGKKKQADTTKVDSMRSYRPDSVAKQDATAPIDSVVTEEVPVLDSPYELDMPSVIRIGLVLPLQASTKKPSENFLDFYSGTLLALRELGSAGLQAELQVYDTADSQGNIPQSLIDESDVIIGPVSYSDLELAAAQCSGKVLISPLEPKAAALAATSPVVQAPSGWSAQVDELVQWVREELPVGEVLYVIRDSTAFTPGGQSAYLLEQLQARGVRYESLGSVEELPLDKKQKLRVTVASEQDNFNTAIVRGLGIEGARGCPTSSTTTIRPSATSCWPTARSSRASPAPSPSRATTPRTTSSRCAPNTAASGTRSSTSTSRKDCRRTSASAKSPPASIRLRAVSSIVPT